MRNYAPLLLPNDIHRLIEAAAQRVNFEPLSEINAGKDDVVGLPSNVIPFRRFGRRA